MPLKAWQIVSLAKGARPEIFDGVKRLPQREKIPIKANTISALKVFLQ